VITAATPMTTPSEVSAVRSLWARNARKTSRMLDSARISVEMPLPAGHECAWGSGRRRFHKPSPTYRLRQYN
jgi:hypothetical protein